MSLSNSLVLSQQSTDFSRRDDAAAFRRYFMAVQSKESPKRVPIASESTRTLHLRSQGIGDDSTSVDDDGAVAQRAVGGELEGKRDTAFDGYLLDISELADDGCGLGDDEQNDWYDNLAFCDAPEVHTAPVLSPCTPFNNQASQSTSFKPSNKNEGIALEDVIRKRRKLEVPVRVERDWKQQVLRSIRSAALRDIGRLLVSKKAEFDSGNLQAWRARAIESTLHSMVVNGKRMMLASAVAAEAHRFSPKWGARLVR
jgi:hypothetical protein